MSAPAMPPLQPGGASFFPNGGKRKRVVVFVRSLDRMPRAYLDAIHSYGGKRGWEVVTVETKEGDCRRCDVIGRANGLDFVGVIKEIRPDGLFMIGCAPSARLRGRRSLPTINVNCNCRMPSNCVSLLCDNRSIAESAYQELSHGGIRNFTFVPWPVDFLWSVEREREFSRIVSSNGGHYNPFPTGKDLCSALAELPLPCAVFAANDFVAANVVVAALSNGLVIPGDLTVIGVDNDPQICENAEVSISSIEQDVVGGARIAAETLERMMNGDDVACPHPFGALRTERRASTRITTGVDRRVLKALEYIRVNANLKLTPQAVADYLVCSRNLADLIFKHDLGHTVHAEILEARIEKAKGLLMYPSCDLSSIHDFCGFNSAADFRRVFKRLVGCSPSVFRRKL